MLRRTTALLAASTIGVALLAIAPASADTRSTPTGFTKVRAIAVIDTATLTDPRYWKTKPLS